ncbi:hypothetical protein CBW56_04355 [Denitratisoma oestradiolicum]|nr:hypothetical protein CBW56_04355 [Denitratisoma oestradiolicum]
MSHGGGPGRPAGFRPWPGVPQHRGGDGEHARAGDQCRHHGPAGAQFTDGSDHGHLRLPGSGLAAAHGALPSAPGQQ